MKIIFLDFDGVLNKFSDTESLLYLSKECVGNLNTLIERSGAKIVISSCWRAHHPMEDLKQILINAGFKYVDHIIGVTPDLIYEPRKTCRGEEISKWLKESNENVESFVIIDDDDDMDPFMHLLVQTNCDNGLTTDEMERALLVIEKGEI